MLLLLQYLTRRRAPSSLPPPVRAVRPQHIYRQSSSFPFSFFFPFLPVSVAVVLVHCRSNFFCVRLLFIPFDMMTSEMAQRVENGNDNKENGWGKNDEERNDRQPERKS